MNNINLQRKQARVHLLVGDIVTNELTNSNIIDPVVMDVYLSNDLSHLKVYVNLSGNTTKGLEALNNAAGYVRTVLSKSLDWRKVPQVVFELDTVSQNGSRIDKILRDIKNEE